MKIAVFLMINLIAMSLLNAEAMAQSALEQLKNFSRHTLSARGEFTQQTLKNGRPGATASGVTTTGSFVFARPGKFRWVYLKPYEQILVADGEKLWIYDKDLNQVTIKKLGAALGESPAAILFGSNELEKNFQLEDAGKRDGLDWLHATPKTRDTTFERISIGFQQGVPTAMELRDHFGQTSLLTFHHLIRHPAIQANEFNFEIPRGADVFEQ